jgi:pimeloyl-ACP methyl ester carboxylesterase
MNTAATSQLIDLAGLRLRVTLAGQGPLVLLCHGFPELAHSWQAQIAALAAAGFRVAAPDMRGYGGSGAPAAVEDYTLLHLVGDMVGLLRQLKASEAVVVGHDWGAAVAWHCALLRPDVFRAVVGMSVPYAPPSPRDMLGAMAAAGHADSYMHYFQTTAAEAEFDADPRQTIRRFHYAGSGDSPPGNTFAHIGPQGLLPLVQDPATLPPWLSEADLDVYAAAFAASGFRGGLNWYRNLRRNPALLAPWYGQPIRQPSLFIAGERDPVLRYPGAREQMQAYDRTLPGLRGSHVLPGAGHWIQRERAAAVNDLLIGFLRELG